MLHVVTAIDAEGPIVDPAKPDILDSWERVDGLLGRLFSSALREAAQDSLGHGPVLSWFVLSLWGVRHNPYQRPANSLEVFDRYADRWGRAMAAWGDGLYWHYHQPSPCGAANRWCADWTHVDCYDEVLARLLVDRGFFPSCFRAGGRIEDNDLSHWLEEIIPFDYSCCSGAVDWDRVESCGEPLRAFCDWSRAPSDWSWYHPDRDDYQRPGAMRRTVLRCPDLASPVHTLTDRDIEAAFARAASGAPTVLATFEHDRRDVTADRLADAFARIAAAGRRHPAVPWRYATAQAAAAAVTVGRDLPAPTLDIAPGPGGRARVTAAGALFNRPFVALGDASGNLRRRAGLACVGRGKWLTDPLPEGTAVVAAAAAGPTGEVGTARFVVNKA